MTADELPTLIVEAWFGGPTPALSLHLDDPARDIIGTATLSGEVWTDITPYVQGVATHRGASRVQGPVVRYEAGTCTIILDNSDRRFDPTNLDGPYVVAGVTEIMPMRAVRVRASYYDGSSTVIYDIWRGTADSWKITYAEGNTFSNAILTASDGFKVLANNERVAVGAVGASENSGARVTRILDSAGWPALDRVIATGDTTLQATTLSGAALTELFLVADTEIGDLYIDGAGRVVFRNRTTSLEAALGSTFTDNSSDARPYVNVELEYDDTGVANDVHISRTGGTQQVASDATSQASFLVQSYERTDLLMETDAVALSYAQFLLHLAKDAELRFSTMEVNPRKNPSVLFPEMLGMEIGDRIQVERTPPGGGDTIVREVFIRGIDWLITPEEWKTATALQSASRYNFLVLDDATLDTLDSGNALAY